MTDKICNDGVCEVNDKLIKMSLANKEDIVLSVCANCGKEGSNLKSCTACKLVKYCYRECQIAHRPQHKKVCKKRAAELHDIDLFKQPPAEDCPICFVRLPLLDKGRRYQTCCGKQICSGCAHAPVFDDKGNEVDNQKCAFCRTSHPITEEEATEREKKRADLDDPIAIFNRGNYYYQGMNGFTRDHTKALELWHRAAELGYALAHCSIGYSYDYGDCGEVDKKKAKHYYELAAMMGGVTARRNLGNIEVAEDNIDRAIKHYTIAIRSGCTISLEEIKELYSNGHATKEDYTKALRLYQEYLGEIKSSQRDKAAADDGEYRYY